MVQARTKHIEYWYLFSSQCVKSGELKVIYGVSELILADELTKCQVWQVVQPQMLFKTQNLIREGVFKRQEVILDSCSNKRMQGEDNHNSLVHPRKQDLIQMLRYNTTNRSLTSPVSHNARLIVN